MKKEPHITEFTAKKGNGLHVRVCTNRNGRRIAVDGGRLYFKDYGTKAETLRAARKIRDEILFDLDFRPSTMPTVEDIYNRSYDLLPVSLSTRKYHESLFSCFPNKSQPIDRVTLEELQHQVGTFVLSHTTSRTKRYIQLWKRIYKTAFLLRLPVIDYSAMLILPKSKVLPKKHTTETTYADFMTVLDGLRESNHFLSEQIISIAWVMYYTGMRIQEVLALYESDIDLESNLIHVRRSIGSTASESAVVVPLKTEKSLRDIPISPALIPVLEKAIAECENDLLFSKTGDPISVSEVSGIVFRIARDKKAKFTLYTLRHLFAADLFRQGTNPKVIQTLMGHTTENMSLYYAFTTQDEKAEAIAKRKPS